jgi:hypothetical protein
MPEMQVADLGLIQACEHLVDPAAYLALPLGTHQDCGHDQPFGRTSLGLSPNILQSGITGLINVSYVSNGKHVRRSRTATGRSRHTIATFQAAVNGFCASWSQMTL